MITARRSKKARRESNPSAGLNFFIKREKLGQFFPLLASTPQDSNNLGLFFVPQVIRLFLQASSSLLFKVVCDIQV